MGAQARQVFRSYGKTKRVKVKGEKTAPNPCKLKKGLTPGSVLILLAGRFRGRRVVFLKQLDSGLLLVSGPFAVNGVPLRRVNQRYCICTSTKIDVSGVNVKAVTDDKFKAEKSKGKKDESAFFAEGGKKKEISGERKSEQKAVDDQIMKSLNADLKAYLKTNFSLTARMYPHEMKF